MAGVGEQRNLGEELKIGPVRVLFGRGGGKYPHGNTLLVEGTQQTIVIDPSLALHERAAPPPRADRVLLSHCHEDHLAGVALYPETPVALHAADALGLRSLDGLMEIYGMDGPIAGVFREELVRTFHYRARPDAVDLVADEVLDLGGVRLRVLHTPGHTRGHSCFRIDWEGGSLLYLGDVDLSSFGPYYGDAWSDLGDFERSLARLRHEEAIWYATFHHIGVLKGQEAFLERLDRFTAKIQQRESRLIGFLAEPHSLEEVAAHRFIYRPGDNVPWAESTERRSMAMHIERLVETGRVAEVEPGRWRRVSN